MVHGEDTNEDLVVQEFDYIVKLLKELKPNDRSDQDRYWAIVITEVEKARAVFLTYATTKEVQQGVVE
jgi:hypothetical protein